MDIGLLLAGQLWRPSRCLRPPPQRCVTSIGTCCGALARRGICCGLQNVTDSIAERNRRAIWGAIKAPGEDAAVNRDSLLLASRGLRLVEKAWALATAPKSSMTFHLHSPWDDDEPENLRSSNRQFGPIGADAGQPRGCRPQIPLAPRRQPSPSFPPRHAKCRIGKETRL